MPHPSTNYLIARVRDFCRWQEKMFCDPSARGAPLEDPPGWAPDKEFWIRNTVWRETIFEGNPGDSSAAADALIDHGLLRVHRRNGEPLTRTVQVRVRELTFRGKNIRTMAVASRGTRVSAGGYLLTKRREASRVTFAADNAELSERTIGCRRMQARVHFSKASRSAKSSLPTGSWRTLSRYCHPIPSIG